MSREFVLGALAAMAVICASKSCLAQRAVIELHSQAVVAGREVRLGDVADVRVGDEQLRRAIQAVDVAGSGGAVDGSRLARRYIDLRLQLAGYAQEDYTLIGPDLVLLTQVPPERPSDTVIEHLAIRELSERWSVPEEDLQVTLAVPVMVHLESLLAGASQPRLEVLPKGTVPSGRISMALRVFNGDQLLAVRPVQFDVARKAVVLTSVSHLASGSVLGAESIRTEERFLSFTPELSEIEQVHGRRLQRPLASGEVLTPRHLAPETATTDPTLVQVRDVVRVTARKGTLTIVLSQAEALQGGKSGQLVRLRNPQSNKVMVGKVVAAGEVEVVF